MAEGNDGYDPSRGLSQLGRNDWGHWVPFEEVPTPSPRRLARRRLRERGMEDPDWTPDSQFSGAAGITPASSASRASPAAAAAARRALGPVLSEQDADPYGPEAEGAGANGAAWAGDAMLGQDEDGEADGMAAGSGGDGEAESKEDADGESEGKEAEAEDGEVAGAVGGAVGGEVGGAVDGETGGGVSGAMGGGVSGAMDGETDGETDGEQVPGYPDFQFAQNSQAAFDSGSAFVRPSGATPPSSPPTPLQSRLAAALAADTSARGEGKMSDEEEEDGFANGAAKRSRLNGRGK